jgi:hypothetical protein
VPIQWVVSPVPLGDKYENEIGHVRFSRLVNSLYSNYEVCDFDHVSWSYWHAVCAPIHIAAVHYGASIEALQNSYIAHHGKNFKTSLIEKEDILKSFTSTIHIVVERAIIYEKLKKEFLRIKLIL